MPHTPSAATSSRLSSAAEHAANPFAMLIDPAAVIAAANRSGSLRQVPRRIMRPLDRPPMLPMIDEDLLIGAPLD